MRWRVATILVVAAMVLPVLRDHDSFPLSTYPMYARARPAVVSIVTAVGVDAAGRPQRLSLGLIGASDDPLIVAGELRSSIGAGRADARCAEIAERVGGSSSTGLAIVAAIEVVTERHDVVAQVQGDDSLEERTVHARCEVPRG
jgi:hypothetical protein